MSQNSNKIPRAWFRVTESKKIGKDPYSYKLKNKKFVIYRKDDGGLVAVSAHCPHMGVNLAYGGKVKKNCLVCPLHGWEFNEKGSCSKIPGTDNIPDFAKLNTFPVQERHGVVYIFNGKEADYPLPFFSEENPEDFIAHKGVSVYQEACWFGPVVNAFDINHFIYSHNRIPYKESEYEMSDENHVKATHYYKIVGKYWFEKFLAKIIGDKATVNVTIWSGSTILVKTQLGNITGHLMTYCTPESGRSGRSDIVVYKKKTGNPIKDFFVKLLLPVYAKMQWYIFQTESDELKDAMIRVNTLHPEKDAPIISYMEWFKNVLGGQVTT